MFLFFTFSSVLQLPGLLGQATTRAKKSDKSIVFPISVHTNKFLFVPMTLVTDPTSGVKKQELTNKGTTAKEATEEAVFLVQHFVVLLKTHTRATE